MPFISQTRLRRTANLTTRQAITPVEVARFDGVVQDVAEAMSYVPPAQRPTENRWGGFDLVYDLRCSIEVQILGLARNQRWHVLVMYDVWLTPASRLAGDAPVLRESHYRAYGRRKSKAALLDDLRENIRARIEQVSLTGQSGDLRDMRLVALADEDDPDGVLADVRELELTRDIDTATTHPSAAPLLPKVVQ